MNDCKLSKCVLIKKWIIKLYMIIKYEKSLSKNCNKKSLWKQKDNRRVICFDILQLLNEQPYLFENFNPCDEK